MFQEATAFYFNHYREHFSTPLIAEVMARIPQVMVWDGDPLLSQIVLQCCTQLTQQDQPPPLQATPSACSKARQTLLQVIAHGMQLD